MSNEESKLDVVKEARGLLAKASRVHALNDTDPSADEDVGWMLAALCDEVEELRRRNETQADSIMEFQQEQKAFKAVANDLLEALVKAVVYAPNVKVAADALRSAITPKGSEQ